MGMGTVRASSTDVAFGLNDEKKRPCKFQCNRGILERIQRN